MSDNSNMSPELELEIDAIIDFEDKNGEVTEERLDFEELERHLSINLTEHYTSFNSDEEY